MKKRRRGARAEAAIADANQARGEEMMITFTELLGVARCRVVAVVAGFMALAFVAGAPQEASAQAIECNEGAGISFTTPSPLFVSDIYTLDLTLGSGNIVGDDPDQMTISSVQYALDCDNNGVLPCTDEGAIARFVGNISDTCDGSGGTTSVSFTSNAGTGDAGTGFLPNTITFTPNVDLVLDPNSSCVLSFDIEIASFGTDATPSVLSSAMGYLGQCANGQDAQASESGGVSIELCEVTVDKQVSCINDDVGNLMDADYVDRTGVDDTIGTAEGCFSWNAYNDGTGDVLAEPITVRWFAENTGTAEFIGGCTLVEGNVELLGTTTPTVTTVPTVGGGPILLGLNGLDNPVQNDCSSGTNGLDDAEPDMATLSCVCRAATTGPVVPAVNAMDMDTADFTCLTPQLGVANAACEVDDGDVTVTGDAAATAGGADLLNCSAALTTEIVAFGADCPAVPDGSGPNDTSPDVLGNIAAGTMTAISFSGTTLDGALVADQKLCAKIVTTCEIDIGDGTPVPDPQGGNKTIMAMDSADCGIPPEIDFICRTPGFWGTHSDNEGKGKGGKKQTFNITQAVIDAAPGGTLGDICGTEVSTTGDTGPGSATEAMCVRIEGDLRRQLARQLTAAALNCTITSLGPQCADGGDLEDMFAGCNSLCEFAASNDFLGQCIDYFDDLNNGELAGFEDCDEEVLVNETLTLDFDPPGPAGGSGACSEANGNGVKTPAVPDMCAAPGDCFMTGHGAGCSNPDIEAAICVIDPFCCDTDWDGQCVGEAESICGI